MKKFTIGLCLVGLACCVIAATTTSTRVHSNGATKSDRLAMDCDSTNEVNNIFADTFYSDTVDLLNATNVRVGYNIGITSVCDSCNDSISVIVTPYIKGYHSTGSRACAAVTFAMADIEAGDDTTRYVVFNMHNDSVRAGYLYFRTILFDSIIATAAHMSGITKYNYVPVWFDVEVTKEGR